jgi:hypothetical protein
MNYPLTPDKAKNFNFKDNNDDFFTTFVKYLKMKVTFHRVLYYLILVFFLVPPAGAKKILAVFLMHLKKSGFFLMRWRRPRFIFLVFIGIIDMELLLPGYKVDKPHYINYKPE